MAATRYETKEKASIEVYGRTGNIIASIKNVSTTGACIEWSLDGVPLEKGDLVRMTVILKVVNRRHNLNAEVVWREGNRSGVNFIKSEDVLEKMVERS